MAIEEQLKHPTTKLRLPYIEVHAAKYDPKTKATTGNFTMATKLGSVKKFEITMERNTGIWRQFDGEKSGLIQETYPSTFPTYRLKLTKVLLRDETALEALGFSSNDLLNADVYLNIWLVLYGPDITNNDGAERVWLFEQCWPEDSSVEFDIDASDLKILQEIEFGFARFTEHKY
jgi:uncharacterized protein Veg